MKFNPTKRGVEKVLAMLKGVTKGFEVVKHGSLKL